MKERVDVGSAKKFYLFIWEVNFIFYYDFVDFMKLRL
jgi:hypothetical protein